MDKKVSYELVREKLQIGERHLKLCLESVEKGEERGGAAYLAEQTGMSTRELRYMVDEVSSPENHGYGNDQVKKLASKLNLAESVFRNGIVEGLKKD